MDAIAGLGFGMPLTFLTVVAQFAVSCTFFFPLYCFR
jgi:hypothetical protein